MKELPAELFGLNQLQHLYLEKVNKARKFKRKGQEKRKKKKGSWAQLSLLLVLLATAAIKVQPKKLINPRRSWQAYNPEN